MRADRVALVFLGPLFGCGFGDDVLSDPIAAPTPPGAWLVWSHDGDRAETVWIDANGAEVARHDGIALIAGPHLWRVESHDGVATGLDCACIARTDPTYTTMPEACRTSLPTDVVFAVDLLDPTQRLELVAAPVSAAALQEGDSSPNVAAQLVASAGPFLFIETSGSSYGCGAAHPNGWTAYEVVDLTNATKTLVTPLTAAESTAIKSTETAAAKAREFKADASVFEPEAYELTELRPRWQADGKLVTEAQLTWEACYACSDGLWGSNSRSARVPTPLPQSLAPYSTAPAAVITWWSTHAPGPNGGWTEVPGDLELAKAAFIR